MSTALDVALAYYQAWTTKDIDRAMAYLSDDFVCDAPAGRLAGTPAFRAFLEPFATMLISATLLAAYGDENQAVLMYDTKTPPVPSAPGAELLTVVTGRITRSRFLFDRLPFENARRSAP